MQSSELPVRVENYFWKELKLRLYWGCLENARNIEMLELMTLKILAKYNVNRMFDCVLMVTIIGLTYATLGEESKISSFLAIIYIIIITIKCFTQL